MYQYRNHDFALSLRLFSEVNVIVHFMIGKGGISMAPGTEIRFIKLEDVIKIVGISKSSIYKAIKNGEFPAPVKPSVRSSRWIESEVQEWAATRIRASRPGTAATDVHSL